MTHHREPGTIHAALYEAIQIIGYDGIIAVTGKSDSTFYKASQPDTVCTLQVIDAIEIDRAAIERGQEPPIFTAYALHLAVCEADGDVHHLVNGINAFAGHVNAELYDAQISQKKPNRRVLAKFAHNIARCAMALKKALRK